MTITDARGFGCEKSTHDEGAPHRVIEDFVEYVKKTRIEIVARDEMVDQIVETIARAAHIGNRGDARSSSRWSRARCEFKQVRTMRRQSDESLGHRGGNGSRTRSQCGQPK
jgi:hypothetical protein